MDLELEGKVAIVTGSGGGIGQSIALTLAKEGANVVIDDIDLDKARKVASEVDALGRRSLAIKADVANTDEANDLIAQTLKHLGKVDILVNNAGWFRDTLHFAESSRTENWEPTINWCLYGAMNCCRAVIEHMIERKSGKIVSIISDAGRVGEPHLASYSAAKGGLIAFSKALAKDVGRHCINVNCVSPGATLTEGMVIEYDRRKQQMGEEAFKEYWGKVLRAYPLGRGLGRLAKPEDIADAVAFLCSERAAFITGQTLSVNGGYTMI